MGGRIWAPLPPDGGTEFGITLRVLESDEDDDAPIVGPNAVTNVLHLS